MSAHTPGPWIAWRNKNGLSFVGPSTNCTVASIWFPPVGEQESNAQLIAAAPDLYAALKEIIDTLSKCEGGFYVEDLHLAAIAKAEGKL